MKWLQSTTKISSLEARPTTSSCRAGTWAQELISSLKASRAILFSTCSRREQYSHPQQQYSPSLMSLPRSQLRWKFSMSIASCLLKKRFSFSSLSYRCRTMLFPTCHVWQKSGEKGFMRKLRMGAFRYGLQLSSPPKMADDAREKKPSPLSPRLNRCFTRHSRSLYSTTTSCPVRQPTMNSACVTAREAAAGLKRRETTWTVAMILRGRMSVRRRVEEGRRDMSFLKGQTQSSAVSDRQSAATMKWWSCDEYVPATMQQGYVPTRSLRIQDSTFSRDYSFSILLYIMNMDEPVVGFTMHMSLKWQWDISFIFESWTVLSNDTGYIILGMSLTILASILSVALPAIKNKVVTRLFRKKYNNSTLLIKERDTIMSESEEDTDRPDSAGEHLFGFFYILVYSLVHIATMMLIMTFNGYVVIAVMVGLTLGYALFGMECDKDKNVPVNCCA